MKKIIFILLATVLFTSCLEESKSVYKTICITDKQDTLVFYGGVMHYYNNNTVSIDYATK